MSLSEVLGLRRHKRFLCDFDTAVHERDHNLNLKARIGNISQNGLLFRSRDSFQAGALVDLAFHIARPAEERPVEAPSPTLICVSGHVTRCQLRPDGAFFEVAVHFTEFQDGHETLFRQQLAQLSA